MFQQTLQKMFDTCTKIEQNLESETTKNDDVLIVEVRKEKNKTKISKETKRKKLQNQRDS